MKALKSMLVMGLALILVLSLCGCQTNAQRTEELVGTYSITIPDSEEQIMVLMESIDAYDEEIALVDMESLYYVKTLTFTASDSYYYAQDPDGVAACVREFYEGYFSSLYEGRTTLNEVYADMGVIFDALTEEEFYLFYAELYGFESYDALIDELVHNAYDYDALTESMEFGKFRVSGSKIYSQAAGEPEETQVNYELENGKLTIYFADGTEVYDKIS